MEFRGAGDNDLPTKRKRSGNAAAGGEDDGKRAGGADGKRAGGLSGDISVHDLLVVVAGGDGAKRLKALIKVGPSHPSIRHHLPHAFAENGVVSRMPLLVLDGASSAATSLLCRPPPPSADKTTRAFPLTFPPPNQIQEAGKRPGCYGQDTPSILAAMRSLLSQVALSDTHAQSLAISILEAAACSSPPASPDQAATGRGGTISDVIQEMVEAASSPSTSPRVLQRFAWQPPSLPPVLETAACTPHLSDHALCRRESATRNHEPWFRCFP